MRREKREDVPPRGSNERDLPVKYEGRDAAVLWPLVSVEPLVWGLGVKGSPKHVVEGKSALVDLRTGKVYNVITGEYRVIKHEDVIDMLECAVDENPDFGTAERTIWMSGDGARMRAEYKFLDTPTEIIHQGKSDLVYPSIMAYHSYDGKWAIRALFGAWRMVCSNGLVIGEKWAVYRREHHQPLEKDGRDLKATISNGMEKFSDYTEMWKSWVDRITTVKEYEDAMETIGFGPKEQEVIGKEVEVSSGIKIEDGYKHKTLSLWVFYNILCQYITHKVEGEVRKARLMEQMRKTSAFQR